MQLAVGRGWADTNAYGELERTQFQKLTMQHLIYRAILVGAEELVIFDEVQYLCIWISDMSSEVR